MERGCGGVDGWEGVWGGREDEGLEGCWGGGLWGGVVRRGIWMGLDEVPGAITCIGEISCSSISLDMRFGVVDT